MQDTERELCTPLHCEKCCSNNFTFNWLITKKKANKCKLKAVVWELQGYSCGANRKPLPKMYEKWLRISARTASLQISGLKCLFLVLVSSRNHTSRCTALRLRVAFVARNRRGGIRFCVFVSFAALALFTFGYFQPSVDGWCPLLHTPHFCQ